MSLGGLGVLLIVGYVVCGVWYVGYVGIVGYVGGPGISLTELAQAIDGKLRVFFLWIGLKIGRQMRLVSIGGSLLVCYYWQPKWRVTRQSELACKLATPVGIRLNTVCAVHCRFFYFLCDM